MPKYIDCEPLINDFSGGESMKSMSESIADARFVEALKKKAPAADVTEVKNGEWVAVPSSDMSTGKAYKCSECQKMRYGVRLPPYCQECGAKMDGKEKE